jgi:hypothetical protein
MLYVQQSLGPNEELVHVGHFHWMYTVKALLSILWGVLACIAVLVGVIFVHSNFLGGEYPPGWLDSIRHLHPGFRLAAFFMFVMGLLRFASMMVIRATTEIAITNSRLIYKRGLVSRYVGEMSIDRIEGVNVLQSILGRLLGYGRIMVRGMGVGEVILPPLANPVAFRKAIDKARNV